MNKSLIGTLGILPVLAFVVVIIVGILSGHGFTIIMKQGLVAALVVGILWGLIVYLLNFDIL